MASLLRINNNIAALNALRNLNQTTLGLSKTLQRLSSGLRIVSAADDPAGLIISEQLRSQVSSLKAAGRNISEAEKYFNIAEAALDEINKLLVDMRALAVHGANGATSQDQRDADYQAFENAVDSIVDILTTTRYAGDVIFDGVAKTYLIGEEATDTVSFTMTMCLGPRTLSYTSFCLENVASHLLSSPARSISGTSISAAFSDTFP